MVTIVTEPKNYQPNCIKITIESTIKNSQQHVDDVMKKNNMYNVNQ